MAILSLGLFLLLDLAALGGRATLLLDVLVVDSKSLIDLGLQGRLFLDAVAVVNIYPTFNIRRVNLQVDELIVVHLKKHAGDLACQLVVDGLDLGEDHLTNDLLLLSRGCR